MFKKAEKTQVKLKIALAGPSGAGKTFSALQIATGIGQKIALIDTENGSASLYANRFSFDTVNLNPPYTVKKYIDAIHAAIGAGYDVVIVDSFSHAWAGEGGILDKKAKLDALGKGNSYTNWNQLTPEQEQLRTIILHGNIHMIGTLRSKQEYVLEQKDGKQVPRRVGMAPVQRDGLEYEFTTYLELGLDHAAHATKDRTGLFDGQPFIPTPETGKKFVEWLKDAKPIEAAEPLPAAAPANDLPQPLQSNCRLTCKKCNAELKYIENHDGYSCPNWNSADKSHARFIASKLAEYQAQLSA